MSVVDAFGWCMVEPAIVADRTNDEVSTEPSAREVKSNASAGYGVNFDGPGINLADGAAVAADGSLVIQIGLSVVGDATGGDRQVCGRFWFVEKLPGHQSVRFFEHQIPMLADGGLMM